MRALGPAAASSKVMLPGWARGPVLGYQYSAWPPNRPSLNPNTRSPTANDATPPPVASTTPANSHPRMVALGRRSPVNTAR